MTDRDPVSVPQPDPQGGDTLPTVGGESMERSVADFVRACRVQIREEQERPAPDTALIGLLCDAVRYTRETERRVMAPLPPPVSAEPERCGKSKDCGCGHATHVDCGEPACQTCYAAVFCKNCGEEIRPDGADWMDCETHTSCEATGLPHAPASRAEGEPPSQPGEPEHRHVGGPCEACTLEKGEPDARAEEVDVLAILRQKREEWDHIDSAAQAIDSCIEAISAALKEARRG